MKNIITIGLFTSLLLLASMAIVFGEVLPPTTGEPDGDYNPFPTPWTSQVNVSNQTEITVAPAVLNLTRGHIWVLTIRENQQTHRWIGYVGNISGNISLQDDNGDNLYEWDLAITSGEIYATRFAGGSNPDPVSNGNQRDSSQVGAPYDYVDWTNMKCASPAMIHNESGRLGHSYNIDNDALNRTFLNDTTFHTNAMDFTVGDKYIDASAQNCSGTFMNTKPDTDGTDQWQMTVLEDGLADFADGDLVYASIIEDDKTGYNGGTYDFQMILPQYGAVLNGGEDDSGDSDNVMQNIAYYFYVELIGEGWVNNTSP